MDAHSLSADARPGSAPLTASLFTDQPQREGRHGMGRVWQRASFDTPSHITCATCEVRGASDLL